jgi:hypothetical protein
VPYLKDPETIALRLADAIQGRTRWVFVTDLPAGHARMADLAAALALRWLALGLNPDTLLDYGVFEFVNVPTLHRATVSVLTIPKSAVDVDEVNVFLAQVAPGQQTDGERDLLLLTEDTPRARETLGVLLQAIADGDLLPGDPTGN